MIKKLALIMALAMSLSIAGCAKSSDAPNTPNKENDEIASDNNKNNEDSSTKVDPPKEDFSLNLYSVDVNTEKLSKASSLTFKGDTTIENSLKEIAKNTSSKNFDGLPIEFVKIDTVDGKKVATINLSESTTNKDKSPEDMKGSNWISGYFQGSTGGTITTTILTENFLQKEYKGEWIDGVKFTYNGKAIESQHAEILNSIIYK